MRIIDFVDFNSITSLLAENPLIPSLFYSVTDLDGKTLSSTRWQRICSDFHRVHPLTRGKCVKSDIILANEIKKRQDYALYSCLNSLTDAAVPIKVEDELIGNLIVGQVFIKPPNLDFFEKQSQVFGFDKDDYLAAIKEVPVGLARKNKLSLKTRKIILYNNLDLIDSSQGTPESSAPVLKAIAFPGPCAENKHQKTSLFLPFVKIIDNSQA